MHPFCFREGDFDNFRLVSIGLAYYSVCLCFVWRKEKVFLLIYDFELIFLFCLRDHFDCGGYFASVCFCLPKPASCRACIERITYAVRCLLVFSQPQRRGVCERLYITSRDLLSRFCCMVFSTTGTLRDERVTSPLYCSQGHYGGVKVFILLLFVYL